MKGIRVGLFAGVWVLGCVAFPSAGNAEDEWQTQLQAVKAQVVELEAKVRQYERKGPEELCPHAHEHGFDISVGHVHHCLDIHQIHLHGGLDFRYVNIEQGNQKLFLHESEMGIGVDLSDWLAACTVFTTHHGEECEVEQAYGKLKFSEIQTVLKAGKFWVNFGPENRAGFFDRRTVTPSAMREGFFGEENWTDEGIECAYRMPVAFESIVTLAVLNGTNAKTFGDGTDPADNNNLIFPAFNVHNVVNTGWGQVTAGGSYAEGKWDADDRYGAVLWGLDAAWTGGHFDLLGEYMHRSKESAAGTVDGSGFYLLGAYTWPVDAKYLQDIELLFAYGESNPDRTVKEIRYSPQLSLGLSEVAVIRFIYDIRREHPDDSDNNRIIAQFAYHF